MKKIFFLAVAFVSLFSSCSKDESTSSTNTTTSQLVATINGTKKTFNTIQVSNFTYMNVPFLKVTASINNNPTEIIELEFQDNNSTGSQQSSFLRYILNNETFEPKYYTIILQTNSNKKLVGTFIANVENRFNSSDVKTITDGSFSISY